ncbi:MAG: N-acetylglucosamine-6-phosphate deacetylase [Vicinamibacterales bacterium]
MDVVISGADLVLPDRVLPGGTLIVEHGRVLDLFEGEVPWPAERAVVRLREHYVVPGFIDIHVHGVDGVDVLADEEAVGRVATALPAYGVTGFCPTSIACRPRELERLLNATRVARQATAGGARVLPAHLESNFISPDYAGAQPRECLCRPPDLSGGSATAGSPDELSGADILAVVDAFRPDVGIVTLAPELPGGLDLVRWLTGRQIRVSLGHSGASFDEAIAAIDAGARGATHLFNRMPPLHHRSPGLVGAVLGSEAVAAELVGDGYHVHPSLLRTTVLAKGVERVVAITDGTAGSGLPVGSRVTLGGRPILVREEACFLEDGTVAGSRATMDVVFRTLVHAAGVPLTDASQMCSTTPARELGMQGFGLIGRGAVADFTVLDRSFRVVQTYIEGRLAYARGYA